MGNDFLKMEKGGDMMKKVEKPWLKGLSVIDPGNVGKNL